MRKALAISLLVLAACGGGGIVPGAGPRDVAFRIISERQNPALCVRGPEFAVATTPEEWRAVWQKSTACQPTPPQAPPLLAQEAGVAAWWKVESCLGFAVRTSRVRTDGQIITIEASEAAPSQEFCATAIGGLESFLALEREAVDEATRVRFLLDDRDVGSVELSRN